MGVVLVIILIINTELLLEEKMSDQNRSNTVWMTDPPFVTSLFNSTRWSWLWLIARLYIGWSWLDSGWGKLQNPAWTDGGQALRGFWERAVAFPEPPARPLIAFDWYRSFLQSLLAAEAYTWFSWVIILGEILVGIALIVGIFVGIAAFFGAFLNWNFMMAGTASTNPVMFTITILLILAWKVAGYWGLDRWVLPALGTPWRPGKLFTRRSDPDNPDVKP
jgi:thiosulfate dehydrogenase (quinone) large subunit